MANQENNGLKIRILSKEFMNTERSQATIVESANTLGDMDNNSNVRKVEKAMKEFSKQFGGFGKGGGKEESALAMRESLGVTLDQAEALQDIYSSTKTSSEKQTEIAKIMEAARV